MCKCFVISVNAVLITILHIHVNVFKIHVLHKDLLYILMKQMECTA